MKFLGTRMAELEDKHKKLYERYVRLSKAFEEHVGEHFEAICDHSERRFNPERHIAGNAYVEKCCTCGRIMWWSYDREEWLKRRTAYRKEQHETV